VIESKDIIAVRILAKSGRVDLELLEIRNLEPIGTLPGLGVASCPLGGGTSRYGFRDPGGGVGVGSGGLGSSVRMKLDLDSSPTDEAVRWTSRYIRNTWCRPLSETPLLSLARGRRRVFHGVVVTGCLDHNVSLAEVN
jgi:hypothetical protein